jgi:prepilin-type N-terminal cleavage/methylation domain-containing protein
MPGFFKATSRTGFWKKGFTLPEVMVSTVIGFILIAVSLSAFSYQHRAREANVSITEMNQNVRTVIDALSRELRMAGYGLGIYTDDLPVWVDFAKDSSEAFTIPFTSNPLIVDGAAGAPDMILVAGAFDPPVTTLLAAAAEGATTLSVPPSSMSNFNTSDEKLIYIGRMETARIISTFGNTLTISTHPTASRGLLRSHEAGEPIEQVKVVSYEWVDENAFTYPREPHMIRFDSSKDWITENWQRILASHIEDIQYVDNGDNTLTITVTGRSSKESPFFRDRIEGDRYRRVTLSSTIMLRNQQ